MRRVGGGQSVLAGGRVGVLTYWWGDVVVRRGRCICLAWSQSCSSSSVGMNGESKSWSFARISLKTDEDEEK
jgi:hypothetical protein